MDKKITRLAGIEFSVKSELALIFGLILTMLLGYPNVTTIPVAAILVFWSNRSLRGSVEYLGVRVRIQIIFGVVDYFTILLFRTFFPEMPTWILFILTCCIILPFFIKCYYLNRAFMPVSLTPIFSNLIILAGLCSTYQYSYRRVLWTFWGCLLGVVLAFIIPSSNKLMTVKESLLEISRRAVTELEKVVASETFEISPAYMQDVVVDASAEMTSIGAYYGTVVKDFTKSTKFPMRLIPISVFTTKFKKYEKDVPKLGAMMGAANTLLDLIKYINTNKVVLNKLDSESKAAFLRALKATIAVHTEALDAYAENTAWESTTDASVALVPQTEAEVLFFSTFLNYNLKVSAFSKSV